MYGIRYQKKLLGISWTVGHRSRHSKDTVTEVEPVNLPEVFGAEEEKKATGLLGREPGLGAVYEGL